MSPDRRHMSREEEEYYYNQRSHSQPGYYDDSQGNPYAAYSQPQPQSSPDYGRNGSYREQAVGRDKDRERYYSEDEDDVGYLQDHRLALHTQTIPPNSNGAFRSPLL